MNVSAGLGWMESDYPEDMIVVKKADAAALVEACYSEYAVEKILTLLSTYSSD